MIRVKIRYNSNDVNSPKAKLLRFDENCIIFEELLQKILQKLGIKIDEQDASTPLGDLFELTLGGDVIVEDTSEIDNGDDLVLSRKEAEDTPDAIGGKGQDESSKNNDVGSKSRVKEEKDTGTEDTETEKDDTSVEDVTKQVLKEKRSKLEEEAIELSGDSDEDESDADDGSVEEGTDGWEEESDKEESSEADVSDDSDYDDEKESIVQEILPRKRKGRKAPDESPLEVIMDEKDVPAAPGKPAEQEQSEASPGMEEASTLVDKAGKKKADQAVKDRIIKLLNTGFHDQSNEHEAKNAMKLAQRLMQKHNLSQALLLKERDAKNKNQQGGDILKGGMVRVSIVNRKTRKPAVYARWISNLQSTVKDNFGVQSFYEVRRSSKCDVVFYGIYTNAQLAAYAFRVATERIAQMTAEYQPEKSCVSKKSSKLCYSLGIVKGISDEVERNIQMEKEKRKRKLDRARRAASKGEAYEESDDEEDDNDHENDGPSLDFAANPGESAASAEDPDKKPKAFDSVSDQDAQESKDKMTPVASLSGVKLEHRVEELEKEQQAAIVLVDHSEKIAEEVLEEHGIKVTKGRKRRPIQFDHQSYDQGIEDSKEIDINQRAIRDEVKVKKAKKAS